MKIGMYGFSVAVLFATSAFGGVFDKAWIKCTTDREPVSYRRGDTMSFSLTVQDVDGEFPEGKYFYSWKRTGDDGITETGKAPLTKEPFVYATEIDKPGFVWLHATVVDSEDKPYPLPDSGKQYASKTLEFNGGAGADVEAIKGMPEPKDFDEFWQKMRDRLATVPMTSATVKKVRENDNAEVFAVTIPCAWPRPVTGYVSIPRRDAKFAARLTLHGYNVERRHDPIDPGEGKEIVFDINAHGYELDREDEYYREFYASVSSGRTVAKSAGDVAVHSATYAFDIDKNSNPNTCYFKGMVYRVMRALQWLKTQPKWNGKDLIASGGSQGGLQTIWAAACGEGVTRAESSITWGCDFQGTELGRNRGTWYIRYSPGLAYFDAVNAAKRIPKTCMTVVTRAGLGDYVCPPSGIAAMYNGMTCPKRIHWMQGSTHPYVPPAYDGRDCVRESVTK